MKTATNSMVTRERVGGQVWPASIGDDEDGWLIWNHLCRGYENAYEWGGDTSYIEETIMSDEVKWEATAVAKTVDGAEYVPGSTLYNELGEPIDTTGLIWEKGDAFAKTAGGSIRTSQHYGSRAAWLRFIIGFSNKRIDAMKLELVSAKIERDAHVAVSNVLGDH